jgi:hypothetical protein
MLKTNIPTFIADNRDIPAWIVDLLRQWSRLDFAMCELSLEMLALIRAIGELSPNEREALSSTFKPWIGQQRPADTALLCQVLIELAGRLDAELESGQ